MTLPASVLTQVEQHGCFSGCYGSDSGVQLCLHPTQPPQAAVVVSCQDCLAFKLCVPQVLLPAGTTSYTLADQLTRHVRQLRGFGMSFSGYHARGPGFWLRAAYYASCGLFLLDGERSRSLGNDLDLLGLAFRHGVARPPDPRMLDPRFFTTQTVYLQFSATAGPMATLQALLTSPLCKTQPQGGFQKVTLAQFQPLANGAPPPAPAAPVPAKTAPPAKLKLGDICPVCKAEVKVRSLLNGTYVGCLC
jgi:hypothetical protein